MPDLNSTPPEHFLEALKRRNLEGKRALIADLRSRKSDKAMDILIDLLEDESWYLRELAVEALSDAPETAVPRLQYLVDTGLWYTRSAAARTLGRMLHAPSLPRLVDLLLEANSTVRESALASVADIVMDGHTRETAALFLELGKRRAEMFKRALLAAHPEAGGLVSEYLDRPGSFLEAVPAPPEEETPAATTPADSDESAEAKKA